MSCGGVERGQSLGAAASGCSYPLGRGCFGGMVYHTVTAPSSPFLCTAFRAIFQ